MEQTTMKKGNFAARERQKNIKNLVEIFKKLRENDQIEVEKRTLFAKYGMETGISLRKFEEYLQMIVDRGWILIANDTILLKKEIENEL